MADGSDTLNIGSIRLRKEYPMAQTQVKRTPDPLINPKAAAHARARIAAIPDHNPLPHPDTVPATPTADLILDKKVLAQRAHDAPIISRRKLPSILAPLLTTAGIFLLVLLLFKAPVIISQAQYALSGHKPASTVLAPGTEAVPAENTLTIAKINIHAPVQYEPSIQEAAVQKALESGVVHYGNTALPGQTGNVAIFGHSSNDWWEPGNFKFVFVLLDKLSPGDRLTLDYQSKRYTYEVTSSKVVEPSDVAVLNPTTVPTLTLITCTPPGTSLRRLVVTAKQIDPDPSTSIKVAASGSGQSATSLPSSSRSFFEQLGEAWNGIVSGVSSLFGGSGSPQPNPAGSTSTEIPAAK